MVVEGSGRGGKGTPGGCSVLPARLSSAPSRAGAAVRRREAGDRRRAERQRPGGPRLRGCGNSASRGACLRSGANFAESPPPRGERTPALRVTPLQCPEVAGWGLGGTRERRAGALRPRYGAAEPNGRSGLRRAPLTLVAMAGGSPAPAGRLVSRAAELRPWAGGVDGSGCGSAAAARRGGSASALLSALRPPRLGDSRRRPRLQFLKVPGCAAPAPAGQASHGPRRARRKRAWGLGRSPASSPAPASALTPPPEAPSTGPWLERRGPAGSDGRRGRGLLSAAEGDCASGPPGPLRAGGRRSPGADGSHPPGIPGPRRGCWRGRGA